MEVPRSLQWAPSYHQLPTASSSCSTVFAPTLDFLASHLAISAYCGGIANDCNCAVPLDPLMQNFHATLGTHPHSPYHRHSPSHQHTYPSQHLLHAQPLVEHIARMVEPPLLREESIRSGHDDDLHLPPHSRYAGAPSPFPREPGPGSMPPMPTTTCQLSTMRPPRQMSTTPTAKTASNIRSISSRCRRHRCQSGPGARMTNCCSTSGSSRSCPGRWSPVASASSTATNSRCPCCRCAKLGSRRGFPRWYPRRSPRSSGEGNRGREPPPTILFFHAYISCQDTIPEEVVLCVCGGGWGGGGRQRYV